MIEVQDSGQPLHVHEFGGEPLVNDVLFDQLEFLVTTSRIAIRTGAPNAGGTSQFGRTSGTRSSKFSTTKSP